MKYIFAGLYAAALTFLLLQLESKIFATQIITGGTMSVLFMVIYFGLLREFDDEK